MNPLRDALQNVRVKGNNREAWPWKSRRQRCSEAAGRVAQQRSLATRCWSPATQRVLVLAWACSRSHRVQICSLGGAPRSPRTDRADQITVDTKGFHAGGGEMTSNAEALQSGSGWVAAGRRLDRDPEFLYAFVIMLKGGAHGNYLPVLYRATRM